MKKTSEKMSNEALWTYCTSFIFQFFSIRHGGENDPC
jgi:hypothetical protein